MGFIDKPEPVILQLYSEALQKFRLAGQGHGAVQPPERDRARIATYFDPLPFWYRPFEQEALGRHGISALRDHPAADGHVSLLGLAERLAPPDPRQQPALRQSRDGRAASASSMAIGCGSKAPMAGSRARSSSWRASIRTRSGPGTPSASAPAPGTCRPRRAEATQGLPAQPGDLRVAAAATRRLSLFQQRSHHRPGGLVRSESPADQDSEQRLHRDLAAGSRRCRDRRDCRSRPASCVMAPARMCRGGSA